MALTLTDKCKIPLQLYSAMGRGDGNAAMMLLVMGADPTEVHEASGYTVLHHAVSKGNLNMVTMLLVVYKSHGILRDCVNAPTTLEGNTPLHIAAEYGFFDIGKVLLVHGAIYNIKNKYEKTPMNLSQNQNFTYLFLLIEELFEDTKDDNLEITFSIFDRVILLNKLSKLQVYLEVQSNQNAEGKVRIDFDSICNITKYLSDYYLIDFILAFYCPKKGEQLHD